MSHVRRSPAGPPKEPEFLRASRNPSLIRLAIRCGFRIDEALTNFKAKTDPYKARDFLVRIHFQATSYRLGSLGVLKNATCRGRPPLMPRAQPRFEEAAGQRLPLGGVNGYVGVRGKQGKKKNKFQGVTPKKKHRTGYFGNAKEAAIALAQLREDLELGMLEQRAPAKAQPPAPKENSKKAQVGVYLGTLLAQQRAVVPTVTAWLLSQQQAAAALAGGMAQAFAFAVA